jgi:hypothetical protein
MYYADYPGGPTPTVEDLKSYVSNPSIFNGMCVEDDDSGRWWAGIDLKEKSSNVKNELKKRAESVGLYREKNTSALYVDQDIVWRPLR